MKVGYADAAYKGRLFYNPYNSASLFIPTPGGRYNSGVVMYPGSNGWYWTSSMYSTSNGWALTINDQTTSDYYHSTVAAFSIRCVAE